MLGLTAYYPLGFFIFVLLFGAIIIDAAEFQAVSFDYIFL